METDETSASRAEFLKLAEATRATIQSAKTEGARSRKVARKSPKEMYKVAESTPFDAFRPANLNYTITEQHLQHELRDERHRRAQRRHF